MSASGSIEQDLTAFRSLVRDGAADAAGVDGYRRRSDIAAARFDLLAALASADGESPSIDAVRRATDVLTGYLPLEPEAAVELAIGLIVTDRVSKAIPLIAALARDPSSSTFTSTELSGWWKYLTRSSTGVWGKYGMLIESVRRVAYRSLRIGSSSELIGLADVLEVGHDPVRVEDLFEAQAAVAEGDWAAGLQRLESLPQELKDSPAAAAVRVRALTGKGEAEAARAVGIEAVVRYPTDVAVRMSYSEALHATGDLAGALHELENAESYAEGADRIAVRTQRGRLLTGIADRRLEGIEILQSVSTEDPDNPTVQLALADAFERSDKLVDALAYLDHAIELGPPDHLNLVHRARLLKNLGRTVEALSSIEEATRLTQSDEDTWEIRAELLVALNRFPEAASLYSRVIAATVESAEPSADAVAGLRSVIYSLTDQAQYADALAAMEVIRDHAPPLSASELALRAELLRLEDRLQESLEQADEVLAGTPPSTTVYGTKAAALTALSRSQYALEVIRPILDANPEYIFGWHVCTISLAELLQIAEAVQVLDEHFSESDADGDWVSWAAVFRAQALALLGSPEEGLAALASADENDKLVYRFLIERRRGGAEKDVRAYLEAARAVPEQWIQVEYADSISRGQQIPEEARTIYQTAALPPDSSESPSVGCLQAWAVFRLGQDLARAQQLVSTALANATDPLPFERLRAALIGAVAGRDDYAAAELERVIEACEQTLVGPNSGIIASVVNEFEWLATLIENDPGYSEKTRQVQLLREPLLARLRRS